MAEGTGASVRRSATLGYDTHYYAVRLTDGSVFRLADETSNMWSSYNRVLPVLVAGCILIIILALVLPAGFWWFVLGGALIAAGIWLLRC